MNKYFFNIAFLFFFVLSAVSKTLTEIDNYNYFDFNYYETNKKGKRTINIDMQKNYHFNFYVLHINSKNLSASYAVTNDQMEFMINKFKDMEDTEESMKEERLDDGYNKKIWAVNCVAFTNKKDVKEIFVNVKGKLADKAKILKGADSDSKRFLGIGDEIVDYLIGIARDFQKKYPKAVLSYYYDFWGTNGLAGVLRDPNGKIVEQSSAFAYALSLEGLKVYTSYFGINDVFDVDNPGNVVDEVSEFVKLTKYKEPEEKIFVTDAAPPTYECALSDGKRMSTSDDNSYKFKPEEMPENRYDAEGLYKVFNYFNKLFDFEQVKKSRTPAFLKHE